MLSKRAAQKDAIAVVKMISDARQKVVDLGNAEIKSLQDKLSKLLVGKKLAHKVPPALASNEIKKVVVEWDVKQPVSLSLTLYDAKGPMNSIVHLSDYHIVD